MRARLDVISGPEEGRSFELEEGRSIVVGRGAPCHCRLRDPRVSRTHFLLERTPHGFRLFDMGSSGGTFVNGRRVQECDLAPDDLIRIGHSELRFVVGRLGTHTPAPLPSPDVLQCKSDESVLATVGKRLAGFEIQAPVGAGRLGFVFRACDPRKNVAVALKILRPEFSNDSEEMRRFVRVMKSAVDVKHPNLVRVYTAGKTGGYAYVVMEYVDGQSLSAVLERNGVQGASDWSYAFRVGVHVARALHAARQHQVVHGNITPDNIMVSRDNELAKVGDLMLSRAIEGTLANRVAQMGTSLAEAVYMSPERSVANAELDARSDIYSLGATLYALLTGQPPLQDDSLPALFTKIQRVQPESLKSLRPAIPSHFDEIVMRMLAKRPEDRFQTPRALLDEFDQLGASQRIAV